MKTRFSVAFICTLLFASVSGGHLAAEANSPLKFKPPGRSRPKITIGAASRLGCTKIMPDQPKFTALVPQEKLGLTTASQPTLMIYLPHHNGQTIKVVLQKIGPGDKLSPMYTQSFQAPKSTGLVRLNLAGSKLPTLAIGESYLWEAHLMCEAITRNSGGEDLVELAFGGSVGGVIERIQPSATLRQSLITATPEQLPQIYAEAGIWYEALDSLQNLRRTAPHKGELNRDWETFLQSAELGAISQKPFAECCQAIPSKLPTP
jgi:Domain of Unknown Function (DUF928)